MLKFTPLSTVQEKVIVHYVQPPVPVMTRAERAEAYNTAFPDRPPLVYWKSPETWKEWVYGIWEVGQDYRNKSSYYGAYPRSYPERVTAMFPDMDPAKTLHLFSGSLQCAGVRVDVLKALKPTIVADATKLPLKDGSVSFVMADPPYSKSDAKLYGPPLPNKFKVMCELARVVSKGGHVAWLDIPKPMYRKSEWELWGEIGILRSTNHRGRFLFLFERV